MFSLFLLVLVLLFGVASGLTKEYIPVKVHKNWSDAQQYCKENYKDLATVTTDEENKAIHALIRNEDSAWIGMYRKNDSWLWSDETSSYFHDWKTCLFDDNYGCQNCVEIMADGWNDQFCEEERDFVCYRNLVLVKDKKTWEEALEYCRMKYIGLASPASETPLQAEIQGSEANKVWTGLRFLNGQWFRVSKESWEQEVPLPSCPDPKYRCGAFNNITQQWENRDCNEQLNFLCYYY